MKLHTLQRDKLNYTAIAVYALDRLPIELRMQLHDSGRWLDILAHVQLAAVESYVAMDKDFRTAYNRAQRQIYAALKAEGYRRQSQRHGAAMQYQRHEMPIGLVDDPVLLEKLELDSGARR